MSKITVLCADAFVHTALQSELGPGTDIELTDVAMQSEQQLLEIAYDLQPDVLLVNGDLNFVVLLTAIRIGCPAVKSIVFHETCGRREVIEALACGAKGCLQKSSDPSTWENAIRLVLEGHIWLKRQLLVESLDWLLRHNHGEFVLESKPKQLTAREWEVVHWVSQGLTNKEIARQLEISDTTVKTHLQHIFSKLAIRRRLQLPIA